MIDKINDDIYVVNKNTVVTFGDDDIVSAAGQLKGVSDLLKSEVRDSFRSNKTTFGAIRNVSVKGNTHKIKCWGQDNQLPVVLEKAIRENHLLPSLLDTKRKIIVGKRLYMYYERWEKDKDGYSKRIEDEEQMPAAIEDFYLESEEHRYFHLLAAQLVKNGNVLTEFVAPKVADLASRKVAYLKAHEAKFWRMEKADEMGNIANAFYKGDSWATNNGNSKDFPVSKMPMLDKVWNNENALHWTGDAMFRSDDYYFENIFMGVLPFSALMNILPAYHDAYLENAMFSAYHVKVRKGMFLNPKYAETSDENMKRKMLQDELDARTKFLNDINASLSGYQNAGKVIWNEETFERGIKKEFPDVEIKKIDNNLDNEGLLKMYDVCLKAIISSVQIHPTIANIETAGKLSSGSEMRNAASVQKQVHATLARQNVLEAWHKAMRINGWDKDYMRNGVRPKFWFADDEIVQLNENKAGEQPADPNKPSAGNA